MSSTTNDEPVAGFVIFTHIEIVTYAMHSENTKEGDGFIH